MLQIWDKFIKWVDFISTVFVCGMVGVVAMQVVLRYIFRHPYVWGDELAQWLFVWVIYLAASVLTRDDAHLTVSIITDHLSPRVNQWRKLVVNIVVLTFLVIVMKQSVLLLKTVGSASSPGMGIPTGLFFGSCLVFVVISAIEMIRQSFGLLRTLLGKGKSV